MSYNFKGKSVYLSGPVTGVEGFNRAAFAAARQRVYDGGAFYVFDPTASSEEGRPHEWWMARCLRELTGGCYDAIALLPGWEGSEGAVVEKIVAESIGLHVVKLGDAR